MPAESITYRLICIDRSDAGPPIENETFVLLSTWREILRGQLDLLLGTPHDDGNRLVYRSPDAAHILEVERQGPARLSLRATLRLDPLSVPFAADVAEIAQTLNCALKPDDGGPPVSPSAEALLGDLCRRALAAHRLPGLMRVQTLREFPEFAWSSTARPHVTTVTAPD